MIYLLHVVEDLAQWGGGFYIPHIPLDQYQEEALKGAEKTLDRVCQEQLQGCPNFQKRIISGDPVQEIIKLIAKENVDLVVMASRGSEGHFDVGSVAQKLLHCSTIPIVTIPVAPED